MATMKKNTIIIRGARVNNLKNIDIDIPHNQLIVITGLSGSGKSSLAFDTIYAEGQRRYVESLSSYARQFLEQMNKPDVDQIEGLSPAIAIDQKSGSHNPRSTVGTSTEIYDYLRLLFAKIGKPHCHKCGELLQKQSIEQIIERILAMKPNTEILFLAPVIKKQKGEHKKIFTEILKAGYLGAEIDGDLYTLSELRDLEVDKKEKHDIDIIINRVAVQETQTFSELLREIIKVAADL